MNLHNISILRQAFYAIEERSDSLIRQLPLILKDKVQDLICGFPPAASRQQVVALARKKITLESLDIQPCKHQKKVHDIFYQVCDQSGAVNYEWVEHHIADDDKIDHLLASVEIAETLNILNAWASGNREKLHVVSVIRNFISNKEENELRFDFFEPRNTARCL
jgi:hypothetical protein